MVKRRVRGVFAFIPFLMISFRKQTNRKKATKTLSEWQNIIQIRNFTIPWLQSRMHFRRHFIVENSLQNGNCSSNVWVSVWHICTKGHNMLSNIETNKYTLVSKDQHFVCNVICESGWERWPRAGVGMHLVRARVSVCVCKFECIAKHNCMWICLSACPV